MNSKLKGIDTKAEAQLVIIVHQKLFTKNVKLIQKITAKVNAVELLLNNGQLNHDILHVD